MIHRCAILFIYLVTIAFCTAQENITTPGVNRRKQTKIIMQEQIKQLKNGALLVRLQNGENAIAALNKIGKNKRANKQNEKRMIYNEGIISAFKNNFTFCPTYFFYSNYSSSVMSKRINEIIFLNDSLQADTSIKMNSKLFLTAEFGIIEQDTAKYFSMYYYYIGEKGREKRTEYYGETDMRFGVLKIMSDQLVQLKKPFPFYTRADIAHPGKRTFARAVLRMNKSLLSYYKKSITEKNVMKGKRAFHSNDF